MKKLIPVSVLLFLAICSCKKDAVPGLPPNSPGAKTYISITDSPFGADTTNTDNRTQIQAALNQGGSIYFPPGTYKVSGRLYISSNTSVFGPGTLRLDTVSNAPLLAINGKNNIQIEQLTLDGNASFTTSGKKDTIGLIDIHYGTDITLNNITIRNTYDFAIESDHTTRLKVSDSRIVDFGRRGINSVFSYDAKLTGNLFDGQVTHTQKGIHGIQFWGDNGSWHDSRNHVVSANVVRNVAQGGIWANGVDNAAFSDNVISNCGDVGIDMEAANYITITGNQIKNCNNGGITTFYGCRNITISGNQVRQDSGYGAAIYLHGPNASATLNITGNDIYTKFSNGIYSDQAMISNTSISSNTIVSEGKPGIRLLAASKMTISDNRITVGVADLLSVRIGIAIEGGSNCLLNANTITSLYDTAAFSPWSADRGGIHLYWVSNTYNCQKNTVTNNVISGFKLSVNDNCWGDASSYNYIGNNRLQSVYRRNNAAWQGKIENNYHIDNPNSLITPVAY
ncbi:right-handed parallel beta-helix repeat-containing protein [Chitinophaga sp.]|uniref:right-handed parallel beta-helix repeat-containing protein n=1 Tax=Chitinophaga sp. TaxID=1869181 RepID=UPI002F951E46